MPTSSLAEILPECAQFFAVAAPAGAKRIFIADAGLRLVMQENSIAGVLTAWKDFRAAVGLYAGKFHGTGSAKGPERAFSVRRRGEIAAPRVDRGN